jgi:hypothetical protein
MAKNPTTLRPRISDNQQFATSSLSSSGTPRRRNSLSPDSTAYGSASHMMPSQSIYSSSGSNTPISESSSRSTMIINTHLLKEIDELKTRVKKLEASEKSSKNNSIDVINTLHEFNRRTVTELPPSANIINSYPCTPSSHMNNNRPLDAFDDILDDSTDSDENDYKSAWWNCFGILYI